MTSNISFWSQFSTTEEVSKIGFKVSSVWNHIFLFVFSSMHASWNTPYSDHLSAAALAIVWDKSRSKILLTKRRDIPIWVLPGGGIEQGETPFQAVQREVLEETTVHIDIIRPLALYHPINCLGHPTFLFECQWTSGTPNATEESQETKFFPLHALPSPFFFIHHGWMRETLFEKTPIIERKLTEITYTKLLLFFFCHPIWVLKTLRQRWKNRRKKNKVI